MKKPVFASLTFALFCWAFSSMQVQAVDLVVNVIDEAGAPVKNAVVYLVPSKSSQPLDGVSPYDAIILQENEMFHPHVLPIVVGQTVSFPNHDNFRHMVYSFSEAKTFELSLYGGETQHTVTFDKEGVVALGCNIHDNMLAYIYVAPNPFVGRSDADGMLTITDVPFGTYTLRTWQERMVGNEADFEETVTFLDDDETVALQVRLRLKP